MNNFTKYMIFISIATFIVVAIITSVIITQHSKTATVNIPVLDTANISAPIPTPVPTPAPTPAPKCLSSLEVLGIVVGSIILFLFIFVLSIFIIESIYIYYDPDMKEFTDYLKVLGNENTDINDTVISNLLQIIVQERIYANKPGKVNELKSILRRLNIKEEDINKLISLLRTSSHVD